MAARIKIISYDSANEAAIVSAGATILSDGICVSNTRYAYGIVAGGAYYADGIIDSTFNAYYAEGIYDGVDHYDTGTYDGTDQHDTGIIDSGAVYHDSGYLDGDAAYSTSVATIGPWPVGSVSVGPYPIGGASLGPMPVI